MAYIKFNKTIAEINFHCRRAETISSLSDVVGGWFERAQAEISARCIFFLNYGQRHINFAAGARIAHKGKRCTRESA
jgi:hypothetical protein